MAAISALTLADSTSTNRTFEVNASQVGNTPARWYEKTESTVNGYLEVTQSIKKQADSFKTTYKVRLPSVDADGNVTHQCLGVMTFITSDKASATERADLRAFASAILSDNVSDEAIVDNTPAY